MYTEYVNRLTYSFLCSRIPKILDNFSVSGFQRGFNTVDQDNVLVETAHLSLPHLVPMGSDTAVMARAPGTTSGSASISTASASGQPLSDLCLLIHRGDRIALTGASGSGKSVLLRTLALLERPLSGEVRFGGVAVRSADVPAYRRAIAYVPQRPSLPGETVRDAFQQPFMLRVRRDQNYDEDQAVAWLARAGKPASFLDKPNATLSGGESQVAALIRTVLLDPHLLLLDEPTAALDAQSAAAVEALVGDWFALGHRQGQSSPSSSSSSWRATRAYLWISHDAEQAARVGACGWHIDAGHIVTRGIDLASRTTHGDA